jgi:amino acid permease
MGQELGILNQPVFALIHRIFPSFPLLAHLVNSFVFAAILGACFSILTSNCWNLFTLAQNGHLPGVSILTSLTKTNVPWVSSMIQGVIACLILAATHDQIPLQNMAVLAQIVSFLLSTIAAVYAAKKLQGVQFSIWIPLLGIGSCLYIMTLCLTNLLGSGLSFSFIAIFAAGIALAVGKSIKSATQ